MSNTVLAAVIGSSFFAFLIAAVCIYYVNVGIKRYEENFTESARENLTDLFIFVDPAKLYIVNIVCLLLFFLITWIASGFLVVALMASVLGAWAPSWLYEFFKTRRQNQFLSDLPDFLLALANSMRAGGNMSTALDTVLSETSGPIKQEFGLFQREVRMGTDYAEALDNLCHRMPVQELALVASGIKISREIGGQLAGTLERLGETIRKKLEMEGKIKSLTAQGKYQGIVMAALPLFLAMIIYHIEPEAMSRLWSEPIGWAVCAVIVVFELLGYHFIKKIVTIDV
ncbi:tight adherence protein B [Marinobacter daqiaonensis]|uniref:Tight adherence protein B n=1 Tax=Marinobacter daqiaonensis TaxID=650891 RepID=A0A1I6I8K2_9GAMM|nr:type II secretion system F family protein [Marinobacter daqiaonensis]SFR62720.1 tight adherence protein B [Marinobacter daqiaonensis]